MRLMEVKSSIYDTTVYFISIFYSGNILTVDQVPDKEVE